MNLFIKKKLFTWEDDVPNAVARTLATLPINRKGSERVKITENNINLLIKSQKQLNWKKCHLFPKEGYQMLQI